MKNIKFVRISEDKGLKAIVEALEKSKYKILFCCNNFNELVGTITDGDIRRALIKKNASDLFAKNICNKNPLVISQNSFDDDYIRVEKLAKEKKIDYVPILKDKKIVECIKLNENSINLNPVVIMAGGLGSRLGELTKVKPKPLMEINNTPIIVLIIKRLIKQGFKEFNICLNYKSDMIQKVLSDHISKDISVKYFTEKKRMGTAGALFFLKEKLKKDFILVNADVVTNLNFKNLIDYHIKKNALITICANKESIKIPFGVIEQTNLKLRNITEKPSYNYLYNAGIYALSPKILKQIPNDFFDMTELIEQNKNKNILIYPLFEYWKDIGVPQDLEEANLHYKDVFK